MIPGTIEYKLKMADDGGFKMVQVPECPVRIMIIYQLIYTNKLLENYLYCFTGLP